MTTEEIGGFTSGFRLVHVQQQQQQQSPTCSERSSLKAGTVPMNSILPIVVVSIKLSFKQDLIPLLILEEDHP
jgi:hypothetical protein